MFLLCLILAAYFAIARGRYAAFGWPQVVVRVLVALPLLLSGIVLHFFHIDETVGIMPPVFPDPRLLVQITGVLEVAGAIGLFVPAWRRRAGLALAVMMIAVFPANIYAAGQMVGATRMPEVPARLTMQVVYLVLILLASYGLPGRRDNSAASQP